MIIMVLHPWTAVLPSEIGRLVKQPFYRRVDLIPLAVDALGVDPQQHVHRVARSLRDLRRRDATVQPQRHRRVPQVIRSTRER